MSKFHVFKKGDTVYAPILGKGVIISTDHSDRPYCVKFDGESGWYREEFLSFEPWAVPAPVHVRKHKKGWYICQLPSWQFPHVICFDGLCWAGATGKFSTEHMLKHATYKHFIGEELPKEE